MGGNRKQGLNAGKFLGFLAVLFSALYALILFGYFGSIRLEFFGMLAAHIATPHMLFVAVSLVFSVFGLFSQKRWCMLAAGILMGASALFMPDYLIYVALPTMLLLFAFTEMN